MNRFRSFTAQVALEARRSVTVRLTPVLAVIYVVFMLLDAVAWRGVWPAASAAVTGPLSYLGPVMGGMVAWEAARRSRAVPVRTGERTDAPLLTVYVICGLVVMACGSVCAVAVNVAVNAPAGFLWPSYVMLGASGMTTCVAVGFLLGRLGGPAWFAPVVSVLVLYLRLLMASGFAVGDPSGRFARDFLSGDPSVMINRRAVVLAVLESAVAVVLADTVPAMLARLRGRRTRSAYPLSRTQRIRVGSGAVACLVVAALVVTGPPVTRARPPVAEPLCTDTQMAMCVWPEQEVYLDQLAQMAGRVPRQAQVLGVDVPARMDAYGLGPHRSGFVLESGHLWFVGDSIAGGLTSQLLDADCVPPDSDPRAGELWAAHRELTLLIGMEIQGRERGASITDTTGVDAGEVARVYAEPPAVRRAWVDRHVAALREIMASQCVGAG